VRFRYLLRFRSLFFKIFIAFWLAVVAVIAALTMMVRVSFSESVPDRLRGSAGEALSLYAEAAVRVYEHEGPQAFREFIRRSWEESGTKVYLFNGEGEPLAAENDEHVVALVNDIKQQDGLQARYHRTAFGRLTWGKPVLSSSGKRYIFVIHYHAPSLGLPQVYSPARIAVSILIAGLVCYVLAFYLTSPLDKLQTTVKTFAEGNLNARVSPKLGHRHDEVADLGREFDNMAERISTLIDSQKRLLADISHELRSPLARLSVALELARKGSPSSSAGPLNRIEQESERLNELVGQLLAITRLESGAERVPAETVVLEELIQQIVSDANFEAKPRHKEVKIVQLDKCRVNGSAELLRSAVENVVRNAIRYTSPGTAVEVGLHWKLDTAELTVRDHGPGVPETELKHIFEPFYRVSEARDRASGGAGLGLSIADRTVKLHGGTIEARNVEGGLLVVIRLPLAPSQPAVPQDQAAFSPASLASG
jgi:two-component system sensor histidine kinase CpxA